MNVRTPRACAAAVLRPRSVALAAAWLALSTPVLADASTPVWVAQNLRAPSMVDVVVTATRTAQPLSDLVADVSIVDRETIERSGATGLADVLGRLPGIEIARNGGPGASTSLFIRGAESRFAAVYIDGVRVDSQSTGGASWQSIPLALIDRIEVLRGPAAAVYGSDALGGVVQVFTRRGEGGFAPFVLVGAGSQRTAKVEAGFAGSQGAWDYALGLARETSQGFNARPIAGQNPDKDGYRSTAAHLRGGVQLNAAHRLEGTLLTSEMNSGYDASPTRDDRSLHRLQALGLHWNAQWDTGFKSRLSVTEGRDRYETTPSPYLTETTVRSYLLHNEWRRGPHQWTVALERREDHLTNRPIDRSRSQDALALGYGLHSGPHTLQLQWRHDADSEFGGQNTGSVAYGYRITPQWRATAAVGTAFRAPTLYQRFSEYGVASLRPEQARNLELGLRYAQGDSTFSVTAYRNRVTDLISFAGAGPCASSFGCYANTARAQYEGVTLAGSHRFGAVRVHGSLDWQNPRDLATGKQLARRAQERLVLGADTRWAGWTWGAEWQATGRRFDNSANTQALGGYGVVHLTAGTRLAQDVTLQARINNLGDKAYQLARTYATAGRTFYVGLKWAPQ